MTKEQIEAFRGIVKVEFAGERVDQVCDLALQSLSQESVRSNEPELCCQDFASCRRPCTPRGIELGKSIQKSADKYAFERESVRSEALEEAACIAEDESVTTPLDAIHRKPRFVDGKKVAAAIRALKNFPKALDRSTK